MDAVRRGEVRVEHPGTFQQADRAAAVLPFAILEFLYSLGEVRMDKEFFGTGKVGTALEQILPHRINGMRSNRKAYAI